MALAVAAIAAIARRLFTRTVRRMALLGVRVAAGADGARLLVLAGAPIGEPVVQYGPFVMNSREEIEQALHDYSQGRLAVNE